MFENTKRVITSCKSKDRSPKEKVQKDKQRSTCFGCSCSITVKGILILILETLCSSV